MRQPNLGDLTLETNNAPKVAALVGDGYTIASLSIANSTILALEPEFTDSEAREAISQAEGLNSYYLAIGVGDLRLPAITDLSIAASLITILIAQGYDIETLASRSMVDTLDNISGIALISANDIVNQAIAIWAFYQGELPEEPAPPPRPATPIRPASVQVLGIYTRMNWTWS
jgi:hypothetical protein